MSSVYVCDYCGRRINLIEEDVMTMCSFDWLGFRHVCKQCRKKIKKAVKKVMKKEEQ